MTDVLVIGGGPAGSALALALLRAGMDNGGRVVIAARPPGQLPFRVGESASPGVVPLLERLGLKGTLASQGHLPCHGNLSVWGGPEPALDLFRNRNDSRHGWHLDRAAFDRWLLDQACDRGAHLLPVSRLESISGGPAAGDGWWRVQLETTDAQRIEIQSRVIADCSGRTSRMAARLGVATHKLDRLVAVAAVVEDSEPEDALSGLSLIEAVAEGWWYAARIPGNRYMLTLMTDSDQLTKSDLRQPQQFLAAWQATEQLQHWVPPPKNALEQKNVSAPAIFPAPTRYLSQACGAGWIAAGDALIGMDPLTAAGIDGALDDALAAAETILRWLSATSGADCMEAAHAYSHRAEESLRRYLMERRIMYRREQRWRDRLFWQRRHDGHTKTHL